MWLMMSSRTLDVLSLFRTLDDVTLRIAVAVVKPVVVSEQS